VHRFISRQTLLCSIGLTGFWAVLLLTGCATQKAYEDEVTPAGEVAVLHIASDFAVWADNPSIIMLDSNYLKKADVVKLEVTPGEHIVHMSCTRRFSSIFTPIPFSGPIEIRVEAEHHYKVYCDVTDEKTYFWIEESTTGRIAGGERP
jgi:hypothetical protein